MSKKVYRRAIWRRAAEIMENAPELSKNTYARSATGRPCSPYSDKAESFCFLGAFQRALWLETGVKVPEHQSSTIEIMCRYGTESAFSNLRGVKGAVWAQNDHPETTKDDMLRVLRNRARTVTGYVEVEE